MMKIGSGVTNLGTGKGPCILPTPKKNLHMRELRSREVMVQDYFIDHTGQNMNLGPSLSAFCGGGEQRGGDFHAFTLALTLLDF